MCLAEVGRVVALDGASTATVEVDGRARLVSLAVLVLEGSTPAPGDWLLVQTGFAVEVLDESEAAELAAQHREVRAAGGERP